MKGVKSGPRSKPKAKAKGRRAKRRARADQVDRVGELIKLQQRSVDHWSQYAVSAARLMAKGTVSPSLWMKQYADLSADVARDVGELIRIMFPTGR